MRGRFEIDSIFLSVVAVFVYDIVSLSLSLSLLSLSLSLSLSQFNADSVPGIVAADEEPNGRVTTWCGRKWFWNLA